MSYGTVLKSMMIVDVDVKVLELPKNSIVINFLFRILKINKYAPLKSRDITTQSVRRKSSANDRIIDQADQIFTSTSLA